MSVDLHQLLGPSHCTRAANIATSQDLPAEQIITARAKAVCLAREGGGMGKNMKRSRAKCDADAFVHISASRCGFQLMLFCTYRSTGSSCSPV